MRYKQIKFAPPGYTPRIHGYCRVSHKRQHDKGNSVKDQEARIRQYIELRKLDSNDQGFREAVFHKFWVEPRAQSAYSRELRQRPAGGKMVDNVEPGDFIIVDKLDRMFRSTIDFLASRRYFAERGVSLHFVNFMGMSVDTNSSGGGMLVHLLAFMAEMESDKIGERVSAAYKQRMLAGRHAGGAKPFFCDLEGGKPGKKLGSGGRLVFKPWAIEAMEKIVQLKDGSDKTFQRIGKEGFFDHLEKCGVGIQYEDPRNAIVPMKRLYWFYKAWVAAGRPDINTIKIMELVAAYKARLGRESHGNADQGPASDED